MYHSCLFTFFNRLVTLLLMPKKTAKTSRSPKRSEQYALRVTIAIFTALVVMLGATVYFNVKAKPFCANAISCISDLSGQKEEATEGIFLGKKVAIPDEPNTPTFAIAQMKNVLGTTTSDNKHIYVDLTNQKLYAYDGNNLAFSYLVSTGKWNKTPTGDFRIWIWLRYTRMAGGDKAKGTYYNLPNVPYTMYYYNSVTPKTWGYSIHGAYWHNNFGHPMSHGCVNMKPEEAGQIFYWSNPDVKNVAYATAEQPGPLITVYGTTPNE